MAEHEQGAERWEPWFIDDDYPHQSPGRYASIVTRTDAGVKDVLAYRLRYKLATQIVSDHNDLAALRQQLADAVPLMKQMDDTIVVLINLMKDEQPLEEAYRKRIYDLLLCRDVRPFIAALASPSRVTSSHERIWTGPGYLEETGYIDRDTGSEEGKG